MRVLSQPPEFGSMGTEPYFLATEAQLLGYYGELYVHSELQRTPYPMLHEYYDCKPPRCSENHTETFLIVKDESKTTNPWRWGHMTP